MIRTRFAPSPTGYLHVGNARTALINYLYSQKHQGSFMLRIDDTDLERSKREYEDSIIKNLEWLGFRWDMFVRQSERTNIYNQARDELIKSGRLYACYETEEELEFRRKMQLSQGLPPIYDRKLSDKDKEKIAKENRSPHYRFHLEKGLIEWQDQVRGHISFDAEKISDPIVIRQDGSMTYLLTSVIDDIEFEITNIIRGEDHVSNTAVQVQMFEAFSASIPNLAHLPLISHKEGKISKRKGGFDLNSLQEKYVEPMTISSFFAKLGTADPIKPYHSLEELASELDLQKFGKSQVNFSEEEIDHLNEKLTHQMSYEEAKSSLKACGIEIEIEESFWLSVKGNLTNIGEIVKWQKICKENIEPVITDQAFLNLAASLLPENEMNENSWSEWTKKIKEHSNKPNKEIFLPLRKAITSFEEGPEMSLVLPMIEREKLIKRLNGQIG